MRVLFVSMLLLCGGCAIHLPMPEVQRGMSAAQFEKKCTHALFFMAAVELNSDGSIRKTYLRNCTGVQEFIWVRQRRGIIEDYQLLAF